MNRRDMVAGLLFSGAIGFAPRAFAQEDRPIIMRIGWEEGRAVVPVTIGGEGPFSFLIDTGGATSLIDTDLARALRLLPMGPVNVHGAGGKASLPTFSGRNLVFGGEMRRPRLPLAGISGIFGSQIHGALAAGALATIDSDLDIGRGEWRFYPEGRPQRTGFVKLNGAIRTERPRGYEDDQHRSSSLRFYSDASINNSTLKWLLDTGAPRGFSIAYDVAKRLKLWADNRPYAPQAIKGVGGSAGMGRIIRADSAFFGGVRFDRPLIQLRGPDDGVRTQHDGIIGLEILRSFNLSTDIGNRSLWVEPHQGAGSPPEFYGLSGLWLAEDEGAVHVTAVGTGSPAAMAGIKIGDRVLDHDLPTALKRINGQPGDNVAFTMANAEGQKSREFTLRPFL